MAYPSVDHELLEQAIKNFAGTIDGEIFDVARWCANAVGVPEVIFYTDEAFEWFMKQVDELLDDIFIFELPITYVDEGDEITSVFGFFLLRSGAFGCWFFDSAGDTIPFTFDEFDPLTLPFHLRKMFLGTIGVVFENGVCMSPLKLRSFEFKVGETYPLDDPIFWSEVFRLDEIACEVEEARRQSGR